MIVVDRITWLRVILRWHGSALQKVWRRVLFSTVLATGVTVTYQYHDTLFHEALTPLPFHARRRGAGHLPRLPQQRQLRPLLGGPEALGRLVNTSRSMTRQVLTLLGPQEPDEESLATRKALIYRTIAYSHALRKHLRDDRDFEELRPFLPEAEFAKLELELNPPISILQRMGDEFRRCWNLGWVHPMHFPALEATLTEFTNLQGGCERIKSTPIPFSFNILLHRIVAVYCVTLPIGIIDQVGYGTPAVVAMVSYAFFGLDAVGEEIENPFGLDANDLPLSAITRMIEVNLRQRLHETDLPPLLKPDRLDVLT
jgi:putative membrane protein